MWENYRSSKSVEFILSGQLKCLYNLSNTPETEISIYSTAT